MSRLRFSRRRLLGNAALMTVAAPFVRSLNALAAEAPPPRLVTLFSGNGHRRGFWATRRSDTDFDLLRILQPLEKWKGDMVLFKGLNAYAMRRCRYATTKHGLGSGIAFTGVGVQSNGWPNDASVDQLVAGRLKGQTPLASLQLGAGCHDTNVYGRVSYAPGGKPLSPEQIPANAYATLFKPVLERGASGGGSAADAERLLARRKSVLDFVREDVGMFKRRLTGTDAANLDLYLEAIRDVERSMAQNAPLLQQATASCDAKELGARAQAAPSGSSSKEAHKAVYDTQLAIAAAALGCGVRRVVTFTPHTNYNPVGSVDYHNVSHGQAPKSHWAEIDKWHAERFATLVGRLKAYGVLSRTILVWGNEIAEDHHQHDCAFVVAGGSALGIKTQQAIRYPVVRGQRSEPNRSWNDLWVSVQKALGKKSDVFGDAKFCTGGLKELFPG